VTLPKVDVVVLTWNDGELLDAAVRSALRSEGVVVSAIVVDNGSVLPPVLPADSRITLLSNRANVGVAAGRNQGVAAGESEFVCFLDSDARLYPETVSRLLAPLLADDGVALSVPVFTGQSPEASAGRAPSVMDKVLRVLDVRKGYRPMAATGPWWEVDFGIGACQLVRRSDFMATGGFDATYFYGPEDVDLCLRLRERGRRVVQVGAARCDHPARRRFRALLTRRGLQHAWAVTRHLWRHRHFRQRTAVA
jgi:GT2 family glycosyltransferase